MAKSVFLGLPPVTHDDKLIYKALAETSPLLLRVNPAPPGVPHEDKAPGMINQYMCSPTSSRARRFRLTLPYNL